MTKKVLFISSNGYTQNHDYITNSKICSALEASDPYPLLINGQPIVHLTELKTFFQYGKLIRNNEINKEREKLWDVTLLTSSFFFSYLTRHGYEPIIINDFSKSQDREIFYKYIEHDILCVAISTTFFQFKKPVIDMASFIKRLRPTVPIIAGGPLVFLSKALFNAQHNLPLDEFKKMFFFMESDANIDYYVVERRGEKSFLSLLQAIYENKDVSDIPNLAIPQGKMINFTRAQHEQADIKDELINWGKLPDYLIKSQIALRGSIGCPFHCGFCNFNFYSPKVIIKELTMILNELKSINSRLGVKEIIFTDDNFFINPQKVMEATEAFRMANFKFQWTAFVRTTSITKENVISLRDSGAFYLFLGVESGNNSILRNMKKKQRREDILNAVHLLNKSEIGTYSTLVIGYPGETTKTVDDTIEMINNYSNSGTAINWFEPFVFMRVPFMNMENYDNSPKIEGFWLDWKHDTMNTMTAIDQKRRLIIETQDVAIPSSPEYFYADKLFDVTPLRAKKVITTVMDLGRLNMKRQMLTTDMFQKKERNLRKKFMQLFI